MSEGYLILNCTRENLVQIELLAKSIRFFDNTRPICILINDESLTDDLSIIGSCIVIEDDDNVTLRYYKSLLASPFAKTIAFMPDQILTNFNVQIWENLRSMSSIVLIKNRYSYNERILDPALYYHSSIEEKSFGNSSILNTIYFNKDKGCDYVFGFGVMLSSSYDRDQILEHFSSVEHNLPVFPKYLWPEWTMTLLYETLTFKFSKFDFIHCIDLSRQENNYNNPNWSSMTWSEFLNYWVSDLGQIKIENFVQLGLVKYINTSWLSEESILHLRKNLSDA